MKINVGYWLGVLFLFCLLFRPPFLPIDLILPLTVVSLYGIFREVQYGDVNLGKLFTSQAVSRLARGSVVIAIIVSISVVVGLSTMDVYSSSSAISASSKFVWTFILLPINIVYFLMMCQKYKASTNTILKMILWATMLQVIIALAAYVVPPFKDVLMIFMQANNWSDRWETLGIADQRMFGFAKALFDTFGYGMGILASVPFILAYRTGNLKFLLTLPFILITILINARTGLIVFGVVSILFALLLLRSRGKFASTRVNIISAGVLVVGVFISGVSLSTFANADSGFSTRTMDDINSYIEYIKTGGKEVGNYGGQADTLFSDKFWTLPDNALQLAVGAGISVYGGESPYDFSSDVGYVNNIWYMGLVGSTVLYLMLISYMRKVSKKVPYWRTFAVAALLSLFIFQVKGNAFWSANLGIAATLLLLAVCVYDQKSSRLKGEKV